MSCKLELLYPEAFLYVLLLALIADESDVKLLCRLAVSLGLRPRETPVSLLLSIEPFDWQCSGVRDIAVGYEMVSNNPQSTSPLNINTGGPLTPPNGNSCNPENEVCESECKAAAEQAGPSTEGI